MSIYIPKSITGINDDEQLQLIKLKTNIQERIENFIIDNDKIIDNQRIILLGSSCALYGEYIFFNTLNDVDIFINIDKHTLNYDTNLIDVLNYPFLHPTYMDRLLVKNNIYYLSKIDCIISMISSLRKMKWSTRLNLNMLCKNEDTEKIKSMLDEAYIYHKEQTDSTDKFLNNLYSSIITFKNLF